MNGGAIKAAEGAYANVTKTNDNTKKIPPNTIKQIGPLLR